MLTLATIILMNFAQTGVDTLPPTVAIESNNCGVVMLLAEEMRNTPDPPNSLPGEDDQIDRGIASITFMQNPAPVNVRIVLITDTQFPLTPSHKSFRWSVELIDKSKPGSGVVIVRDFAGNAETKLVSIGATQLLPSTQLVETGIVEVGQTQTKTVTITNTTGASTTLTDIHLQTGTRFTITQGAVPPSVALAPNATHTVVVTYLPTLASETGDADNLLVTSNCSELTIPASGTGGVARITTEDWSAGQHQQGVRVCKPTGITVTNGGNIPLLITDASSTSAEFTFQPMTYPLTIQPGATAEIGNVCYEATTMGPTNGSVVVNSNAHVGDTVAVLTAEAVVSSVEDELIPDDEARTSFEPCLVYDARGILRANLEGGLSTLQRADFSVGMYFIVYPDAPRRVRPLLLLR